ncbi:MAG: DUF5667 domain-containing protein [Blastococcus sp.]
MNSHSGTTASPRRAADREDAVVTALHRLAPSLDGEPDPAFRAATRARLVAMAAVRTPAPAPPSRLRGLLSLRAADAAPSRLRARLSAGLAGAALTVTALAALVAVSTGAHPGDALYGLKRGTEQTQLALAGDSARGTTLLDFASTRLDELRTLVGRDATALPVAGAAAGPAGQDLLAAGASPALVLQTLHTMDAQTSQGAAWFTGRSVSTRSAAPLDQLADWAAGQSAGLAALRGQMPAAATRDFGNSLGLLAGISTRTAALRPALTCAGGPSTTGTDALGPVPGACTSGRPGSPPAGGTGSSTRATGSSGSPRTTSVPGVGGNPAGSGSRQPGTGAGTGGGGGVTAPTTPTLPSTGGIVPTTPTVPSLPLPTVTLPGLGAGTGTAGQSPSSGLGVCVPPLLSVGNC